MGHELDRRNSPQAAPASRRLETGHIATDMIEVPANMANRYPPGGRDYRMSILGWLFFGLITGFIASKIINRRGEGCFLNVALGVVGALVGGAVFALLGHPVFFQFSLGSMIVAILGAVIVLLVWHAATGRRTLN
jgi:uncharacterized membrane protein YeaQ/YmgE (transglycosylase-associated protein family)